MQRLTRGVGFCVREPARGVRVVRRLLSVDCGASRAGSTHRVLSLWSIAAWTVPPLMSQLQLNTAQLCT